MYYQWKVIFKTGEVFRSEFHDSKKEYFKKWLNKIKGELMEFEVTTEEHRMHGKRNGRGEMIVHIDS